MSLTISDLEFEKTLLIDEETLFEMQYYDKLQNEFTAPSKIGMEGILSAIWNFITSIFDKIGKFFSSLFGGGNETAASTEEAVKNNSKALSEEIAKFAEKLEEFKKENKLPVVENALTASIGEVFKDKTIMSVESLSFLIKAVNIYIGTGKLMIEHITPVAEKITSWMSMLGDSKEKFLDEFEKKYLNGKSLVFNKDSATFDTSTSLGKMLQSELVDKLLAQFKTNAKIFFTTGDNDANLAHLVNGKLSNLKKCPSVNFITKDKHSEMAKELLKALISNEGSFAEFKNLAFSEKYQDSTKEAKSLLKCINQCSEFSKKLSSDDKLNQLKESAKVADSLKTMISAFAVISTTTYRTCFVTPLVIMKMAAKQLKMLQSVLIAAVKKLSGNNDDSKKEEKSNTNNDQNNEQSGKDTQTDNKPDSNTGKNTTSRGRRRGRRNGKNQRNNNNNGRSKHDRKRRGFEFDELGNEKPLNKNFHGELLDGNLLGNVPLFSVNQGGLERLHQLDDVNYQEDIYTPICAASDVLTIENDLKQLKLSFLTPGCEGLISLILRFFTKLADTIGSLLNNFRMVYRAFRGLKRAEIHTFQEKNFATIRRVKRQSFFDLAVLPMPKPKGLTSTYLDATNALTLCLNACDMVNRSKSFVEISENILERVEVGATVSPIIGALNGTSSEVTQITNLYGEVTKCFANNHTGTAPFKSLFRSMDEFSQVHDELDKSCSNEYDVTPVFKNLEKCSSNFEQILSTLKKQKDADVVLNKDEIVSISDACLFMAKTFDIYGLSLQDLNRVEHNYVEVIKEITRVKKL